MRKINQKNKICIYLDQFVISDILQNENPLWTEISGLLKLNYDLGNIYCPVSSEHILETVRRDIHLAKIHDDYLRSISGGYVFKSDPFLTAQLISSLIRKNNKTLNTFLQKYHLKNIDDFYEKMNKDHDFFSLGISSNLSLLNDLRKVMRGKLDKISEAKMMTFLKSIEVKKFKDRISEYLKIKWMRIRPDGFGDSQVPNWIDQLLYQLTYKHNFKEKEFRQLLVELENHGFDRIPPLDIRFSIVGYLAVKNKQENSSDHIDIMRISSYLFSSDVFFTDKKRKNEICNLGLDKKYKTAIFSGVEQDLKDISTLLKSL